ncbi:MAG: hypothetical protein Kow0092_30820 [Deferrisomatales bacterium]
MRAGFGLGVGAALLAAVLAGAPGVGAAGAQEHLIVGLNAFRDGFHDLAAKELRIFLEQAPEDPRRSDVGFVLAQAEIALGRWQEARRALEAVVRLGGPRGAEASYWLGWVAFQAGDREAALEALGRYLDGPDRAHRADALWLAGALAEELARSAEAADKLESFLREFPGDARAARVRAALPRAWLAAGDAPRAVEAARTGAADPAVGADPGLLEAVALAGVRAAREAAEPAEEARFWALLGERARAAELRTRARFEAGSAWLQAGEDARARKALDAYLEEAPEGPWAASAHLLLAEEAQRRGERARALAHVEHALEHPADGAVAPQRAALRRDAFHLALALGDRERAARHGEALLAEEAPLPADEQARVRDVLARRALERGDTGAAVAHWDAVPPEGAGFSEARLSAAQALVAAGRGQEALDRLAPLLERPDPDGQVRLTALAAADLAGQWERAAALCAALAEDPPPEADPGEFLFRRALYLGRAGGGRPHEAALRALAEQHPDHPRARWAAEELARAAFARKEWAEVLPWARAAGEGRTAAYLEAEALWHLGRLEEAGARFAFLARAQGPYRPEALARLGAIRDAAGESGQAAALYRSALEAGLDGPTGRWAVSRLGALLAEPP